MALLDQLASQFTGDALSQLSNQLGTDESTTSSAIGAALPMLVSALAKNASSDEGAASLSNALQKDHDGGILDNLGGFLGSADNGAGPAILGHILGNKQSGAQAGISQISGMDAGKAGSLLENLAPVVMGMLGKQQRSEGLDIGGLAGMLMGARNQAQSSGSPAMDMIGSLLDQDGDGSFLDDVGGMLGGLLGKK
ncbi:MAG: DUF937 domain-containing protein [Bacteroidota bacterium]